MKKLVVTILTLLTCGATYALPVGNPAEASMFLHGAWWDSNCCDPCDPCFSWFDAWSFRIGYYGDFVFNRHLELHIDERDGEDIDETEIFTNAGYIALNICDRADIFGTLGATNIWIKTDARSWGFLAPLESELFFRTDFSWSIGGRATLWQCDNLFVGLEGQYFQTNTEFDNFVEYNGGTLLYFNDNNDVRYSEWQVGLGMSYRFATSCPTFAMVPYAAVKWAGSRFDLDDFTFVHTVDGVATTFTLPDLENKKFWGWAAGVSVTLCDSFGVTVEGRWADEKALYVNGQLRF